MDRSLYEEHARLESDHWWFVARRAILDRVLARHLPVVPEPPRRILDVGCGTGGMLPMLARWGDVTGLEGEPLAIRCCENTFPEFSVKRGDIPDDVPSDGSFDVATAFDVIEHIEDELGALGSLQSAVRRGGHVVVTVPALSWLWSDHDVVNGHKRRYSRSSLIRAIERSGLDLVHISYFNTMLLPAVAAARLAQRRRRRPVAPSSDFTMPSRWLNGLLTRAMSSERAPVASRGLPVGVSLVAVANRPA